MVMNLEQLIKEGKGTVVDVRTREEYMGGHVAGSLNIPMQEIVARIDEVKALQAPLIFCCASGGRSGQVNQYVSQLGIECYNGGSWLDVNYYANAN
jgi:phage shock protein E